MTLLDDDKEVDPKAKKVEEKDAGVKVEVTKVAEKEIKVAEDKGEEKYDAGKTEAKLTNDPEKPKDEKAPEKEAGKAATTTTKTDAGTFPSSGQPQWEGKAENNNKPEMPTDKNTKASADDHLKAILAALDKGMVKTSNLKPEIKSRTKEYWRALYDEDYADAMVADK